MKRYPSPPTYQLKPLHRHIDGGFGAIGDAFLQAAHHLERLMESEPFQNALLPVAYLYRHSVELYLKSVIIILHRAMEVPFGEDPPSGNPKIKIGNEWVPVNRIHGVTILYRYFKALMEEHLDALHAATNTDWRTVPEHLGDWIAVIEEFDARSTFFRYPGAGNEFKSDFRDSSISEIWASMGPDSDSVKAFIELDENDQIVEAYLLDPSGLDTVKEALRKTADILSMLHFALRCELTDGN